MIDMLKGKIAWVTGAASGMGEATAKTFAREGAIVIVGDYNAEGAKRVAAEIEAEGGSARFYGRLDVSSREDVDAQVTAAVSEFGRLDVLAAFAGKSFDNDNLPRETHYERTFAVNMTGTYNCCMAAFPVMKEHGFGSIIICSSNGSFNPTTPAYEYHMAKGACESLARNLAFEGAQFGVRVNAIKPGCILTAFWNELIDDEDARVSFTNTIAQKEVPLKRVGTAQDIANVALFFASELSSYVTGLDLYVGGGQGYIYSSNQSFLLSDDAQGTLQYGVH